MNRVKKINVALATLLFMAGVTSDLMAQGSDLGNIQLDVIRAFEGQVQQARKLNDIPKIQDTLRSEVELDYRIKPRSVFTDFTPNPLAPARIRRVHADKLPKLMVRFGAGNYLTPLAEVSFNSERSRNQSWGVQARHFSTQSGVSNVHYAERQGLNNVNFLSENKLGGHYRRFFNTYTLSTQAEGFYYANNYYGVPSLPNDFNNTLDYGDVERQHYLGTKASVSLMSQKSKHDRIFDEARVGYHYLTDRFGSDEHFVAIPTKWSFPVDDYLAKIDFNTHIQSAQADSNALNAQYANFHIFPHIEYLKDNMSFVLGGHIIYNHNEVMYRNEEVDVQNFYVFPQLTGRLKVVPNVIEFYGGVDYDFRMQNTADLTREIPWLNPGILVQPTRKIDGFAGVDFLIMPGLNLDIKGQYMDWRNRPLVYRDPLFFQQTNSLQGLDLLYVTGNELSLSGSLQYQYSDDLRFGARLAYSRYEFEDGAIPYHLAPWRGGINTTYNFRKKIVFKTELVYIGQREAFNPNNFANDQFPEDFHILSPFWDVDFQVDYYFNNNLTAFIKIHNMLAYRYDMYLGYGAQRFLAMAGFSFRL